MYLVSVQHSHGQELVDGPQVFRKPVQNAARRVCIEKTHRCSAYAEEHSVVQATITLTLIFCVVFHKQNVVHKVYSYLIEALMHNTKNKNDLVRAMTATSTINPAYI